MKKCTKCKKVKGLTQFNKDKYAKCGLSFICRACATLKVKAYKRTKAGLISVIYSNQKSNAIKRGRKAPNYTKIEFSKWLLSKKKFHKLYLEWVNSGFNKNFTPSCDRIDDYKDYSLDILRVVTWSENNSKHYIDVINGKNRKHLKAITGTNINTGNNIDFYSISKAGSKLGISRCGISNCLTGKTNSSGGYKWRYKIKKHNGKRSVNNR